MILSLIAFAFILGAGSGGLGVPPTPVPAHVQGILGTDTGATPAASSSATLSAPVTSGNMVAGSVAFSSVTATVTITDDKSNSYTVVDTETRVTTDRQVSFYALNLTNGPKTVTVTLSTGTGTFWRVVIDEFSGVLSSAALDQHGGSTFATVSGTDSMSSGAVTPAINGELVYGGYADDSGRTITHGTGFTTGEFGTPADQQNIGSEYLVQSVAASRAATFTPSSSINGSAIVMTFKP